ncbi:MAG: sigma-70 family RNA polymerase sigma factor, partial [Planctomycetales bacterium]|nr:sigma-70 family RNA polymerase sigma factor [Planctomycetales bacterium]
MNTQGDTERTNELLARAADGDESAFEVLFSEHRSGLVRFIQSRMDARLQQRFDASDVIQETHLESIQRVRDFVERKPMPFALWIRRTALERFLKMRRRHLEAKRRSVKRENHPPDLSTFTLVKQLRSDEASPSENVRQAEQQEELTRAIQDLADHDREIVLLRNVDGFAFSEIAAMLDIEPATARKRYGRALIKLQKILVRSGEEQR